MKIEYERDMIDLGEDEQILNQDYQRRIDAIIERQKKITAFNFLE